MEFKISDNLLQAVCNFLVQKPFNEVNVLLQRIQTECTPLPKQEKENGEVDSESAEEAAQE